jgi:hypothetical protein
MHTNRNFFTLLNKLGVFRERIIQAFPMSDSSRVHVLLSQDEAKRFDAYCRLKGFKKSTLIARLIREHLDRESFEVQQSLFERSARRVMTP